MNKQTLKFKVECTDLKPFEVLHVVGNLPELGSWNPKASLLLTESAELSNLFEATVEISKDVQSVEYRYLKIYHLDPYENRTSTPVTILSKFETFVPPRSQNVQDMLTKTDTFGVHEDKNKVSDGWITNNNESIVYFRIHGEALKFYNKSHNEKEFRLKILPFDVRLRQEDIDSEYDEPTLPCYSETDLSVLTRMDPIFGEQYSNGSVFRNNIDYLVFRTRTVSIQHLGFRVELFHKERLNGLLYIVPSVFQDTHGTTKHVIMGTNQLPIGTLNTDYMIAKRPPGADNWNNFDSLEETYGRYWRKAKILEIGHRGMGSSYTKSTTARENTIYSLNQAAKNGADYVELDVQLTKDNQVIVYHDFHVLVTVAGRQLPLRATDVGMDNKALQEVAIKDLNLMQLKLLHLEHISRASPIKDGTTPLSVTPDRYDTNEMNDPFPLLEQVLRNVDERVGINIEVKYPMYMTDGSHECANYFEQNAYVDKILEIVAKNAGSRRLMFSCFEPDICTLIAKKQHRYPVMFLVIGATTRYTPFRDIRSDNSIIAANFAAGSELLGVNFHSEELLHDTTPIEIADRYNLVKIIWGDDLNSRKVLDYFKQEMNVDGLIFDRIGEDDNTQKNIFVVEDENKRTVFPGSMRNSPITP